MATIAARTADMSPGPVIRLTVSQFRSGGGRALITGASLVRERPAATRRTAVRKATRPHAAADQAGVPRVLSDAIVTSSPDTHLTLVGLRESGPDDGQRWVHP